MIKHIINKKVIAFWHPQAECNKCRLNEQQVQHVVLGGVSGLVSGRKRSHHDMATVGRSEAESPEGQIYGGAERAEGQAYGEAERSGGMEGSSIRNGYELLIELDSRGLVRKVARPRLETDAGGDGLSSISNSQNGQGSDVFSQHSQYSLGFQGSQHSEGSQGSQHSQYSQGSQGGQDPLSWHSMQPGERNQTPAAGLSFGNRNPSAGEGPFFGHPPVTTDHSFATRGTGAQHTPVAGAYVEAGQQGPETGLPFGNQQVPTTGQHFGSQQVPVTGLPFGNQQMPTTAQHFGSQQVPETGLPSGSRQMPTTGQYFGSQQVAETGLPSGSQQVPAAPPAFLRQQPFAERVAIGHRQLDAILSALSNNRSRRVSSVTFDPLSVSQISANVSRVQHPVKSMSELLGTESQQGNSTNKISTQQGGSAQAPSAQSHQQNLVIDSEYAVFVDSVPGSEQFPTGVLSFFGSLNGTQTLWGLVVENGVVMPVSTHVTDTNVKIIAPVKFDARLRMFSAQQHQC